MAGPLERMHMRMARVNVDPPDQLAHEAKDARVRETGLFAGSSCRYSP